MRSLLITSLYGYNRITKQFEQYPNLDEEYWLNGLLRMNEKQPARVIVGEEFMVWSDRII